MAKREPQRSASTRSTGDDARRGDVRRGDAGRSDAEGAQDIVQMPFEQAVSELESILERIEQGEIGLEESLRQFRRGDALVKRCRAILDAAELQVRELAVRDDDDESGPEDDEIDGDDHGAEGAAR